MATVVMMIGRSRMRPAVNNASLRAAPPSRCWFAKSTSRIPFFVTRPISMMMPIIVITLMLSRVMSSATVTPMKLSGSASMIAKGWRNEPKSDARIR